MVLPLSNQHCQSTEECIQIVVTNTTFVVFKYCNKYSKKSSTTTVIKYQILTLVYKYFQIIFIHLLVKLTQYKSK